MSASRTSIRHEIFSLGPAQVQSKRQQIVREIYDTEYSYISQLNTIITVSRVQLHISAQHHHHGKGEMCKHSHSTLDPSLSLSLSLSSSSPALPEACRARVFLADHSRQSHLLQRGGDTGHQPAALLSHAAEESRRSFLKLRTVSEALFDVRARLSSLQCDSGGMFTQPILHCLTSSETMYTLLHSVCVHV